MPRNAKVKKVLDLAKGFRGRSKNCYAIAKHRVQKALQYAYVERRLRKRNMRRLWIQQMNAAVRLHGIKYGNFVHALNRSNIEIDRKILAQLCQTEPLTFKSIVEHVTSDFSIPITESDRR